jgi:hypothetical protein
MNRLQHSNPLFSSLRGVKRRSNPQTFYKVFHNDTYSVATSPFLIIANIFSVIPATERQASKGSAYREGKRESTLSVIVSNEAIHKKTK